MSHTKQPSSPNPRIWFILLGILFLAFIAGGYKFYHHESNAVQAQKYDEMKAIADLKIRQMVAWRQEREADARIHSTGIIRTEALLWLKAPADDSPIKNVIKERLQSFREYQGYDNLILAGTDGRILLSLDPGLRELEPEIQQLVRRAVSSQNVVFGEFFQCSQKKRIHLDVAAPIPGADNRPAAVLILRTDPAQNLYPLIQTWPMPSKTAETLIVRRDGDEVVFLNTLRHRSDPPLTIRVPMSETDVPAVQAALGRTGMFRGHDYRGKDVLADMRPVPGSPWFMVAKADTDEILAELRYRGGVIGIVTLLVTLLAGTSAGYLYKHQGKRAFQAFYQSERDRRKAEEVFKTTLYSIGDAVITTDVNGNVRQMNPVAEQLTGWTETDAKGNPIEDVFRIISESTGETVDSPVQKVLEKGLIVGLANHTLLISKDGTQIPIADSGAPIREEDGEIIGVVLVFRDQTPERDMDRLLRARLTLLEYAADHSLEELLQKTVDEVCTLTQSPVGFYHFVEPDQKTLTLQAWSTRTVKEFCKAEGKFLHYPIDQAGVWVDCVHTKRPVIHNDYASLPHKKGLPEGHAPVIRELVVPILRAGRVVSILGVGNKPADYTKKDVEITTYLADVAWEITERKREAEILVESEARFRLLYQNSPVGYHSLDAQGNILDINKQWLTELGYTREEVIGRWFGDFLAGDGPGLFRQRFETFKSAGEIHGVEFDIKHKNGSIISVSFEGRIGRDAHNAFSRTHCVFINITERRRAAAELHTLAAHQQALLSAIPDIIMEVDINKVYTWANQPGYDFFGRDVIGKEAGFYFEGEQSVYDTVQPLFKGSEDTIYLESWQRRRDGQKRLLAWWCRVIKDQEGNATGALSTARDITDLKTLEGQLRQAQKMESVGRLAGGVAHDFNNMLMVIIGYTEMVMGQVDPELPIFKDLQEILDAAKRSASLTRQLLAFARKQVISPVVLDINETISSMLKLLRQIIGEDIDLAWKPGLDVWPVKMDPAQIDQMLANLLVNAKDAIGGVGSVTIETGNIEFDERYCEGNAGFVPGKYVMMAVSDTGGGMDKHILDHIFEPFFTTKEVGKGTGLGLATLYGIVKQNNGFINVYSEPGQGTTFKIYLPRTDTGLAEKTVATADKNLRGTETVLLVEDEESILNLGASILAQHGYTVLSAKSPLEALALAKHHDGPVHLLVTDVVMPRMNGKELQKKLCAIRPGIKSLYMSGYTANAIAHHGVLDKGVYFLQKPFSVMAMAEKVREVLDER